MPKERITVTLPPEVLREIDRRERNRSRFVLEAVRRELERRRRSELRRSLRNPHPETHRTADLGFDEWRRQLPVDEDDLIDPEAGTEVRWRQGEGWTKVGP